MKGHTFEPGRLIAGATAVAVAVGYGLDAAGTWDPHPLVLLPALLAGLVLAALVTALTHAARRNRRRAHQSDQPAPPPLGDLPMASLREGHEALRATREHRQEAPGRGRGAAPGTGGGKTPGGDGSGDGVRPTGRPGP
ncbi:hypothetical protein ACMA1D_28775 [Streptomyces sp. 796.1]|uniref:hypothetical protein n=1 Tax=Streptomyces sp. 796.1 TaxID=3163029 RepID=UPI0039C8E2EB